METMTNKDKEAYLSSYRISGKKIDRLTEEIGQWRIRSMRMFYPDITMLAGRKGPGKVTADKCEIKKYLDAIEHEVMLEIRTLRGVRAGIRRVIDSVDDPVLRLLLEYRYINGMTFMEIGDKMVYSYVHITRLHKNALNEVKIDVRSTAGISANGMNGIEAV